jgi:ribosomal protein S18 acetylase RimI-like enzyme
MIRPATLSDSQAIARVHVSSWRSTFRGLLPDDFLASLDEAHYEERWNRLIGASTSKVYVVDAEDGIVGFASGGRERAGVAGFGGELYAIFLIDSAQRRGFGISLVRALVGGLRDMGLDDMIVWVLRDNWGARHFYERLGGVYVATQPITFGSASVPEVSYGWRRLKDVRY